MKKVYLLTVLFLLALLTGCATKGKVVAIEDREEKVIELNDEAKVPVRDWEVKAAKEVTPERAVEKLPEVTKEKAVEPQKEVTREAKVEVKAAEKKPVELPPVKKSRTLPNKAFKPGEKLTFAISYLGLTAATAQVEVGDFVKLKGNKCYHVTTTAKVVPLVAAMVRVDDVVETYFDADGLFSRRMIKSLREGNYEKDVVLEFDQDKSSVREIEKSGEKYFPNLPDFCQDILSAFFYFRTQELEVGKNPVLEVYADGKVNKLKVEVLRKERVRIPLGTYNAIVVRPLLDFESIFKQEGEVLIWLSDDERHVPLMMKSKVFVVSVSAKLIDASLPK